MLQEAKKQSEYCGPPCLVLLQWHFWRRSVRAVQMLHGVLPLPGTSCQAPQGAEIKPRVSFSCVTSCGVLQQCLFNIREVSSEGIRRD